MMLFTYKKLNLIKLNLRKFSISNRKLNSNESLRLLPSTLNEYEFEHEYGKVKIDNKISKQNHVFSTGYYGYDVLLVIDEINTENLYQLRKTFDTFFKSFEKSEIYKILVNVKQDNTVLSIFPEAMPFTKDSSVHVFLNIVYSNLVRIETMYQLTDSSKSLIIQGKKWAKKEDIFKLLKEKEELRLKNKKKKDIVQNIIDNDLVYLLKKNDTHNSIKIVKNTLNNLKKKSIEVWLTPYKISNLSIITGDSTYTTYSIIKTPFNQDDRVELKLLCFHHLNKNIYHLISNGYYTNTWTDVYLNNNRILRSFGKNKIYFLDNKIINVELPYNFPLIPQEKKSRSYDNKIGVIDLETFSINKEGKQLVYAGGWKVSSMSKTYYVDEFENLNGEELVRKLFVDIFNYEYHNHTFFVHNLSGFDYIFIIRSLTKGNEFKIKPIIKEDNTLISLKIYYNNTIQVEKVINNNKIITNKVIKRSILLLDSYLMLNSSLKNLCKEMGNTEHKGIFPYKFINSNTLFYKGSIPAFEMYSDISYTDYKSLYPRNYVFDVKTETLNYLSKDLSSLLQIIKKFSQFIFDNFKINITTCKTISGLSFKIYLSNYYKLEYNLKEIKGKIETEIRNAYYGGSVLLPEKGSLIKKGNLAYYYDFNSFYPSIMLKPMPVGNPYLSLSKDLDSYFGFCYAKITPPLNLTNYIIPYRNEEGSIIYPSKEFTGIYWSELLKKSREYGYKIEILGGYQFEKGENIFKDFILNLYDKRLEAKKENKSSFHLIYKLILNSLYGRFGMKQLLSRVEFIEEKDLQETYLKKRFSFIEKINDKYLIKYNLNSYSNSNLINYINNLHEKEEVHKMNYLANLIKQRGVPSSVPISAAITAYAQMELMNFKNIKGNKLLYSDTDSLLMEKPLPDNLISETKLGKLKLEYILKEAIFISPKFYALKTVEGEEIVKTKGISKGLVTYEDITKLCEGIDLTVPVNITIKDLTKCSLNIKQINYKIESLKKYS